MYNTIKIKAGDGGWGGPLTVTPTEKCHTILCVTGGGIHPVAQKLADLSGADVVPVGLSLGEAEPETIEYGVPAVLFSRIVTGPLAVIIAFIFSIGLY